MVNFLSSRSSTSCGGYSVLTLAVLWFSIGQCLQVLVNGGGVGLFLDEFGSF